MRAHVLLFCLLGAVSCFGQVTFDYNQLPNSAGGMTAIGDFNHDGNPDLAVVDFTNTVSIYFGVGSGNFNLATAIQLPIVTYQLYAADMKNDGKLDLVMMDGVSGKVFIYYGDGRGHFPSSTSVRFLKPGVSAFGEPTLRIGDFNGDGRVDLVARVCPDDGSGLCTTKSNSTAAMGASLPPTTFPLCRN